MLAEPAEGRLLLLHAQGELVGPVRLEDLERLLQDRQSSTGLHVAVHSLLGHSPEALSSLIGKIAPETVSFWLHDHFTLCESFTLQRNSVAFCGAPTPTSPACGICIYGSGRRAHLDRIAAFFTSVAPDVIAPSRFQLDFWSARSDLPCRSATVHDLAVLGPAEDRARPSDPEGPLRIAYAGWPADHKGWGEFCELSALARKEDAEFHYFGNDTVRVQRVQVHPLHVTPDTPSEAAEALWTAGIDIVLHWASWPETFSFTTHEALAADALVVTSPDSGNVAALASRDERICVLPDKDALFRDVLSGEIAARALRRRAERRFRRIDYAAATADVIFGRRTGR
jgi:hypothetical protein